MGDPTRNQLPIPAELAELLSARIIRHIREDANGCWIRTNRTVPSSGGYTHISHRVDGIRKYYFAHRVMCTYAHGSIPDGYTVDHLCNVRACCNPAHLSAVPHHQNVNRGENNFYAINARKTHCVRGHELPPYVVGGVRICKPCRIIQQREYRARKRAS